MFRIAIVLSTGLVLALAAPHATAGSAVYQVTFESTWSGETHPTDFPPSAHFSPLNGGTHTDAVSFWQPAALASAGIRLMAEQGNTDTLSAEVQAAITAGDADQVLLGPALATSPGTTGMTFTVDEAYPLVTLVTMIAPSPDWFVGVAGLALRENGAWVSEIVVPLVSWDSGTDSGPTFISPNQPTMPPVPIHEITTGPLGANNVVGTFTFTLVEVVGVGRGSGAGAFLSAPGPNPFEGETRFAVRIPDARSGELAVFGVDGRRVRTLFRGTTSGALHAVVWDGRDGRGARVSPGVYLAALRVDGQGAIVRRIVVAR